jgi:hypothetical protein
MTKGDKDYDAFVASCQLDVHTEHLLKSREAI